MFECKTLLFNRVVHHTHHRDEADEFVEIGALNGIFVLGRSMGFIGKSFLCTHCYSVCMYTIWQTLACTSYDEQHFLFHISSGHYLDQKRLKQGLYRHPWDDISYVLPEHMSM